MDPIHPIAPGPPAISRTGRAPVERPERITRERDRPAKDGGGRKRREPSPEGRGDDPEDDGRPHIDVLV